MQTNKQKCQELLPTSQIKVTSGTKAKENKNQKNYRKLFEETDQAEKGVIIFPHLILTTEIPRKTQGNDETPEHSPLLK